MQLKTSYTIESVVSDCRVTSLKKLGDHVVIGLDDGKVHVIAVHTGQLLYEIDGLDDGTPWALEIAQQTLYVGKTNGMLCLHDIQSGTFLNEFRGDESVIRSIIKIPNKDIVATGNMNGHVHIWVISSGVAIRQLLGHSKTVLHLAVKEDTLISASYDGTIRIWDYEAGTCRHILQGHQGGVYSLQPIGRKIITGGLDFTAKVWDVHSGTLLATLEHPSNVPRLEIIGQDMFLTTSKDIIQAWSLISHKQLWSLQPTEKHFVTGLAVLASGTIVTSGKDNVGTGPGERACGMDSILRTADWERNHNPPDKIRTLGDRWTFIDRVCTVTNNKVMVLGTKRGRLTLEIWEEDE